MNDAYKLYIPLDTDREVQVEFVTRQVRDLGRDSDIEHRPTTLAEYSAALRALANLIDSDQVSGRSTIRFLAEDIGVQNAPVPSRADVPQRPQGTAPLDIRPDGTTVSQPLTAAS